LNEQQSALGISHGVLDLVQTFDGGLWEIAEPVSRPDIAAHAALDYGEFVRRKHHTPQLSRALQDTGGRSNTGTANGATSTGTAPLGNGDA
jgi:hypothetical protein